jgi:hypothetical protein
LLGHDLRKLHYGIVSKGQHATNRRIRGARCTPSANVKNPRRILSNRAPSFASLTNATHSGSVPEYGTGSISLIVQGNGTKTGFLSLSSTRKSMVWGNNKQVKRPIDV